MLKTLVGGLGDKGESADDAPNKKTEVASDVPPPQRRGKKAEAKRPADFPDAPPVKDLVAADVKMEGVTRRLDNGMEVVVVENHEAPLVSVRLGVLNGAYEEAKVGAGSFAAAMDEGHRDPVLAADRRGTRSERVVARRRCGPRFGRRVGQRPGVALAGES